MGYLEATARLLPGIAEQGQAEVAAKATKAAQLEQESRAMAARTRASAIEQQQRDALATLLQLGLAPDAPHSNIAGHGNGFQGGAIQIGDLAFTATTYGANVYALGRDDTWASIGQCNTPGELWAHLTRLAQVRDGKTSPVMVGLADKVARRSRNTPETLVEAAALAYIARERERREQAQANEEAEWQQQCDGLAEELRDTLDIAIDHTNVTRLVTEYDDERHGVVIATLGAQQYALDNHGTLCVVRFCPVCEVRITARTRINGLGDLGAYLATRPEQTIPPICPDCPGGTAKPTRVPDPPTLGERLEALFREIAAEEAQVARGGY